MRTAREDPQSAAAGCRLDPSNKQTTFQKSGYQLRHTTRSGRRKGSPHSQSVPKSVFPRRVTSQSALRDHPSGSSFNTDLDSRMGTKHIQPSDDFHQRVQFRQVDRRSGAGVELTKLERSLARYSSVGDEPAKLAINAHGGLHRWKR